MENGKRLKKQNHNFVHFPLFVISLVVCCVCRSSCMIIVCLRWFPLAPNFLHVAFCVACCSVVISMLHNRAAEHSHDWVKISGFSFGTCRWVSALAATIQTGFRFGFSYFNAVMVNPADLPVCAIDFLLSEIPLMHQAGEDSLSTLVKRLLLHHTM